MKTYSEKLKDPRWQRKRLEIMQIHDFSCDICGDKSETLHVHHNYYVTGRNPWEYPDFALSVFCKTCHSDHHNGPLQSLPFEILLNDFGFKSTKEIVNFESTSCYAASCIRRSSVTDFHEWLYYQLGQHRMFLD